MARPRQARSPPDPRFMGLALQLARRGLERVSPNPMVGAVLVRGGRVVGQGYHHRFGGAHAEVEALRDAGDARGADLYVTLEPCAHHGKTPPCVEAVLRAGVSRVFYAVPDPNPITRGLGPRVLRRAGVAVHAGMLAEACALLNAPFFHWIRTGMPWVVLKWAMTLDGRTATGRGESRWITGETARAHAHGLRRRVDAVMVGTETALRDDPRLVPRPARGRRPARIILDRLGRLPLRLHLLCPGPNAPEDGPRIYVTSDRAPARRRRLLETRGVQVLVVRERASRLDLRMLLKKLGSAGISQLLVEGGAALAGSCVAGGLVNEVAAYVAPRILGDAGARSVLAGAGIARLAGTPWLAEPMVHRLGDDLLIQGVVKA